MFQRAPPDVNGFAATTRDAGLDQIVPVANVLRVAVSDDEDDDGARDDPAVLVLLPALVHEPGLDEVVDVVGKREVDDVGRQACDHGLDLGLRCAVRLVERDILAGGGGLEAGDQLAEGDVGRRVGDERDVAAVGLGRRRRERRDCDREQGDALDDDCGFPLFPTGLIELG